MNFFLLIPLALMGWLAGSLINYISDVLPQTRKLSPVECPGCQARQGWLDYLLMRPCRGCGQKRRIRAWVVQVLAVAVTIALSINPSTRLGFWPAWVLLVYFGVVTVIDMEHKLILHVTSLVGALLGLAIGWWLRGPLVTLLGGLAGAGIMLALVGFGYLVAGWLGKMRGQTIDEEPLGFGDVTLSGVLGLMMGWPGIIAGLTLAIFIGGGITLVYLVYQLIRGKYTMFQAIPYGPFLVASAVVLLILR